MSDPLTLATVSATVLAEGIKFLYGQAGEVLKRWRDRRASKITSEATEDIEVNAPEGLLTGDLAAVRLHLRRTSALEDELRKLRRALNDYADGIEAVDPADEALVEQVDGLRRVLELVYGQRITFAGEHRESSGTPVVVGAAEIGEVAGYAAAVRARRISRGSVRGELRADRLLPGGTAVGVEVGEIGGAAESVGE